MSYTKTTWINDNPPKIVDSNLNHIEQGIADIYTAITTLTNQIESFKRAGDIKAFAGNVIPNGWLLCDGREVEINTYPVLYNAIGSIWGVATTSGFFKLPDLQGKSLFGQDLNHTNFNTIGYSNGSKGAWYHAHSGSQAAHTHTAGAYSSDWVANGSISGQHGLSNKSANYTSYSTPSISVVANGSTNNQLGADIANLPPYIVVKYIICTGQ